MKPGAFKNGFNVAIIGGGITGCCAVETFFHNSKNMNISMKVHLFDQGERGVGGRSSHRRVKAAKDELLKFDHGCQFFRADTPQFKSITEKWIQQNMVQEWTGRFVGKGDFFGMPHKGPFYVGVNGMQSLPQDILNRCLLSQNDSTHACELKIYNGTRVAQMERDSLNHKWKLYGVAGKSAFHDTQEEVQQRESSPSCTINILGLDEGYDAVITTDVSSSFGRWHRASAGLPDTFANKVKERVGARVPLFSAMVSFDQANHVPFDAATFEDDSIIWFASKNNSKPGLSSLEKECWTLISTPEYAMKKIKETPMQDPVTGEFIPQRKDYLRSVPGLELQNAFIEALKGKSDSLINERVEAIPRIVYMNAQRWGSAMPSHRHLNESSKTRQMISGVPYDSGRGPLAPTKLDRVGQNNDANDDSFLADVDLMLFQAGDMVSCWTPGFEGAALSGVNTVEFLMKYLTQTSLKISQ